MTTVVPWAKSSISEESRPDLRSPSITPRSKSGGVVSTLTAPLRPVFSSKQTRSVKVPPTSVATRIFTPERSSATTAARGLSSGDVRSDEEHQYPERRHQDDDDDPGPVPCASGRRHSSPPFSGVEEVFARAQVHRFRSFPPEVDYVLVPDPEAALQIDPGLDAEHVADLQLLPVAVPQIGLFVHLEP